MAIKKETAAISKKQTNPIVYVGIGCLVLLVLLGIGGAVVGKFFARQIGFGVLSKVVENKTGIKTNIDSSGDGHMTMTDPKTGTKVDIGTDKLPDGFPKDFPVYPGAKITSTLSGAKEGKANGIWLTLSTSDDLKKVTAYYSDKLSANGWTVDQVMTTGDGTTQTLSKDVWSGTVAITRSDNEKETMIVIVLSADTTPTEGADSSGQ